MTLRLAIGHRADVWGTAARDPDEEAVTLESCRVARVRGISV